VTLLQELNLLNHSLIYLQRDKDKYIGVEIIGTDLINTETKVIKLLELPYW
jgi:hypothetical protein